MVRRLRVMAFVAAAAALWGAGPLAAVQAVTVPAGALGQATWVPGLGDLNQGKHAGVESVSCPSAANCVAGGFYRDRQRHTQGFVVSEKNGRWGRAAGVTGLGVLNQGGNAGVWSVSCGAAGSCAAGGNYRDRDRHGQGFVVSEKNGRWGRAVEVPGLGALNLGGNAWVWSVSCGAAGSCAAGGYYTDGDGHQQGFVVSETSGVWGQAIEVPGLAALNLDGNAWVWSVSCGAAGSCVAGGYYTDGDGHQQGFVVSETSGVWGQAIEVPGLAALNLGGNARVRTVSCGAAGSCAAGGYYTDSSGFEQGFVANETGGTWGQAIEVPGLGALNGDSDASLAFVASVSCASPGNCLAGGAWGWPYSWAFVASETNGVWGQAIPVPGLAAIVTGRWAYVETVSCASPGNCAAGGDYENFAHNGPFDHAFLISQRNGRWGKAVNVPGLGTLNKSGTDGLASVSCGSAASCTSGGAYTDRHGHLQGYVTRH